MTEAKGQNMGVRTQNEQLESENQPSEKEKRSRRGDEM